MSRITKIWMLACTGDFSQRLEQAARHTDSPPLPQSCAFDRAVDWISGPELSPEMRSQTAKALQRVIQHKDVRRRRAFTQFRQQTLFMQTGRNLNVSDIGERPCSDGTLEAICKDTVLDARAIYAATLLKGGRSFRALGNSFEAFLQG